MEPVAEHEDVGDLRGRRSAPTSGHDAARRAVEQRAHVDADGGPAPPGGRTQVPERETGVDEVFDDDDVAPAESRSTSWRMRTRPESGA